MPPIVFATNRIMKFYGQCDQTRTVRSNAFNSPITLSFKYTLSENDVFPSSKEKEKDTFKRTEYVGIN